MKTLALLCMIRVNAINIENNIVYLNATHISTTEEITDNANVKSKITTSDGAIYLLENEYSSVIELIDNCRE